MGRVAKNHDFSKKYNKSTNKSSTCFTGFFRMEFLDISVSEKIGIKSHSSMKSHQPCFITSMRTEVAFCEPMAATSG
jgi:hypothetical protein